MRTGFGERGLELAALAVVCAPALWIAARFALEGPGADPIKTLTHASGDTAIRFLLVSLAITPLRRWLALRGLAPLRRTFGLAAFAYAVAHVLTWSILDLGLDPRALADDLFERPYVMAGMAAFTILCALAATSTRAAMRRLGRRWTTLHRAVYAAAALALLHHFWLIKADYRPAFLHAGLLAALLGARLAWRRRGRQPATEVA